jgi:hypothetical protein
MSLLLFIIIFLLIFSLLILFFIFHHSSSLTCPPNKTIPPTQHCSADNLVCNHSSGVWECNGNCDPNYSGPLCNCTILTEPLSDVCNGIIKQCQSDGTITTTPASTCFQLTDYMIAKGLGTDPNIVIDQFCHNSCQFSGPCNAQGTSCECQQTPTEISLQCFNTCPSGSAGPNCEYHDSTTCSSHGKAQYDGSCQCIPTYNGPNCQYSDLITCNGHGSTQYDGSCKCSDPWAGSDCSFNINNPATAWVSVCDSNNPLRICSSQLISYDPAQRAKCAISGFPGQCCALAADSYTSGQKCQDKCKSQSC